MGRIDHWFLISQWIRLFLALLIFYLALGYNSFLISTHDIYHSNNLLSLSPQYFVRA